MKKVLLSVNPKWVAKICHKVGERDGEPIYEKRVEIRKTKPKVKTPFTVLIYETKGRTETPWVDEEGHHIFKGRGQVIGEFVCNEIEMVDKIYSNDIVQENSKIRNIIKNSCVDAYDLLVYLGYDTKNKKPCYGWHITELVIYDEPRELGDFKTPEWFRDCEKQCDDMERMRCPTKDSRRVDKICGWCRKGGEPLKRPPQSWCYVEERE